jgi:hypothetical protein
MPNSYRSTVFGIQSKQFKVQWPCWPDHESGTEQAKQHCRSAPPPNPADQTRHMVLRERAVAERTQAQISRAAHPHWSAPGGGPTPPLDSTEPLPTSPSGHPCPGRHAGMAINNCLRRRPQNTSPQPKCLPPNSWCACTSNLTRPPPRHSGRVCSPVPSHPSSSACLWPARAFCVWSVSPWARLILIFVFGVQLRVRPRWIWLHSIGISVTLCNARVFSTK